MAPTRLIWTKSAIEKWANGRKDPMHTISAPNIADVYQGYVDQLRRDTPWVLVDGNDNVLDTGTVGFPKEVLV